MTYITKWRRIVMAGPHCHIGDQRTCEGAGHECSRAWPKRKPKRT